jgi:transposase
VEFRPEQLAVLPPEIADLIRQMAERIAALEAENVALRGEVAELKRRLGMNSTNSSKPPSSDSMTKPESPEKGTEPRSRGAKAGRKGKTRNDFGKPDRIVPVPPEECPDCGTGLADVGGAVYDRRQVAELVEKPFMVTEYQSIRVVCPCCGKTVDAPVPEGTLPGFSLGPRLVAFLGVLDHYGNVPYEKMATIFREGFNLPISEGTIDNANKWLHASIAAPVTELWEYLRELTHAHLDETGWRIDGARHWAWAVATDTLTFVRIAVSRGAKVVVGLLSGAFSGLISCDFWHAYRSKDGVGGERAYCWAHLDREAKGIIENGWGDTAEFGRALRRIIGKGYVHWRGFRRGRISEEVFRRLAERQRARMSAALEHFDGKLVGNKAKALHKRLGEHFDGYFNWYRYGVPPDNSLAERAIRPIVVNRKVSGGNRSEWGAELTAFMHTVLGTCRKQGLPVFETLAAYLLAFAHPGRSYPSLVPTSSCQ